MKLFFFWVSSALASQERSLDDPYLGSTQEIIVRNIKIETRKCTRAKWFDFEGNETEESVNRIFGSVYTCYNKERPVVTVLTQGSLHTLEREVFDAAKVYGLVCESFIAITYGSDAFDDNGHYFENFIFDSNMKTIRTYTTKDDYIYSDCNGVREFLING